MGGSRTPEDGTPRSVGIPDLGRAWDDFRAGRGVSCARDGDPVALCVDGSAGAYRFVCVGCGSSSPWFEAGAAGPRVRGVSVSTAEGRSPG